MNYKVIQWATGSMGKTCLRAIIDHPSMELAGLFVYSPGKVGLDAGEIARRDTTSIIATDNIEDILQLDADIVLHTAQIQAPYSFHNGDICRLLASGKNVISINGHSYPQYWGDDYSAPILEACQRGNSSLFGCGLDPGFVAEKIATIATGVCLELDHIEITEVVECNVMQNPAYVFDTLGFGTPCDELDPNDVDWEPAQILNGMYAEVVAHLVERLGFKLEAVETDHVIYPASGDIRMAAGVIKQGTVSHANWRWHGIVGGRCLVTQSIHWIMETAHLADPNHTTWTVRVKGLPSMDITMDLKNPVDHQFKTTPEQYGVAGSLINAIPAVVAAPPGIRELPLADLFRSPESWGRSKVPQ